MSTLGPCSNSLCQPSSSIFSSGESSDGAEDRMASEVGLLYSMARPALLSQRLVRVHRGTTPHSRRNREMTPDENKDATYWEKRQKNNRAAKKSRDKRRFNNLMIERELLSLSDENAQLRAEMLTLQYHLISDRGGPDKEAAGSGPSGLSLQHGLPAPHLYPASTRCQAGGMWGHGGLALDSPDTPRSQSGCKQELLQFRPFACTPSTGKGKPGPGGAERSDSPQLQVSSSGDQPGTASTTTTTRPESWLMPQLHHPAWQNRPMVPWGLGYLSPPALYPPLYMAMEYGREMPPAGEPAPGFRYLWSPHV